MDNYSTIASNFHNTVEAIALSVDELAGPIDAAGNLLTQTLLQDGKIVCCGNGVDSALALIMAANLMAPHSGERPALPAITLPGNSAALASGMMDEVYARQVRALGQTGDALVCINSGTSAANLARAVDAAHERNMRVVTLSNASETQLPEMSGEQDVAMLVNAAQEKQVVELLLMAIHGICSQIDGNLFGTYT